MSNIRINDFPSRKQYTYAGGARTFVIDFPFFENTDIYVYVGDPANNYDQQDPDNLLTYGVDYTLTGAGLNTGGVVTIDAAFDLSVNDTVTIVGRMAIDRFSIYENSSVISMAQLNEDFNRLVVMVKNLNTIVEETMPKYDRSEVINTVRSDPNTPFSYVNLPLLEANEVWIGNADSTGIDKGTIPAGGTVGVDVSPQRPSIALWTGSSTNVLTDSAINISGTDFVPLTGGDIVGIDDTAGAFGWPAHNTASRPAGAANGDVYYDTDQNLFYGFLNGVWTPFGTSDSPITVTVTQPAHGFTVGQVIKFNGGTGLYELALADSAANAESIGFVSDVASVNVFTIQVIGYAGGFVGLSAGEVYFLSATTPGAISTTEPSTTGYVSKPVLIAIDATTGWILHYRGLIITDGSPITPEEGIVIITVTQVAHGFVVGDIVYNDADGTYAKAQADNVDTARAVGIVVNVIDANTFDLQQSGFTTVVTGKTPATHYWLSDVTAGAMTSTTPATVGFYDKPIYQAVTANSGWILPQKPTLISSAGGGGSIIQVVDEVFVAPIGPITMTTGVITAITGFEATITPSNIANRVKISIVMNYSYNNLWTRPIRFYLYRNGVVIAGAVGDNTGLNMVSVTSGSDYNNSPNGGVPQGQMIVFYVDSPASVAAQTYSVYAGPRASQPDFGLYINRAVNDSEIYSVPISTIILEEIG